DVELRDPPGGLGAVHVGHPDVHQDHVHPARAHHRHRLCPVGGLPDALHVVGGVDHHPQTAADQGLVVGEQDLDHLVSLHLSQRRPSWDGSGRVAVTSKPPPVRGPALNVPLIAFTRSRIPLRPEPPPSVPDWPPIPSSATLIRSSSGLDSTVTVARAVAPACLRKLVTLSWTIRK